MYERLNKCKHIYDVYIVKFHKIAYNQAYKGLNEGLQWGQKPQKNAQNWVESV